MANQTIQIIIGARDEASGVLGRVSGGLQGLAKVGIGAAVAGLAGLTAVLGTSIGEAMKAQEAMAGLDAVLKSTGGIAGVTRDAALDLASSLQKVTRFSDEMIIEAEKVMLTFTGIGKDVFPDAIKAALDMSTVLGTDLQSSVIQIGKALQDPILGVTALRRVGVNFNEAQMEMIKTMVEAGDVMGAQRFILQELQTEFGGAAEAAGQTFAGQLDILKNQISDVQEKIGFALLPLLQKLMNILGPMITGVAEKFAGFVDLVAGRFTRGLELGMDPLRALAFAFEKFLPEEVEDAIRAFIPALEDMWAWIGQALPQAIDFLSQLWSNTLQPALQGVAGFVQEHVFPLLQNLAGFLSEMLPVAIDALKTVWQSVLEPVLSRFGSFLQENVFPILGQLLNWLAAQLPGAAEDLKSAWETTIKPAIETLGNFLQETVLPALDEFGAWLQENLPPALDTAAKALGWFKTNILDPIGNAIGTIVGAAQGLLGLLAQIASWRPPPFVAGALPTGPTHKALGGFVWPGREYIVGEYGEEKFRPLVPGWIIPFPGKPLGLLEPGGGGGTKPPGGGGTAEETFGVPTGGAFIPPPTTTTTTEPSPTFTPLPSPIIEASQAIQQATQEISKIVPALAQLSRPQISPVTVQFSTVFGGPTEAQLDEIARLIVRKVNEQNRRVVGLPGV